MNWVTRGRIKWQNKTSVLTEPTNVISPGQQGRKKKYGAGWEIAGAVTFKRLCVSLKLYHHGGPNFPSGLLGHHLVSTHIPDSAWEELGMDIPSQGTKRASVGHEPCQKRTGTRAFVEPAQLFELKGKCPRSLGDTSRRCPIR